MSINAHTQNDALRWHLAHNHYPPVPDPESWVPTCREAIRVAQLAQDTETWTLLGGTIECPTNRRCTVSQIMDGLRLEDFLSDRREYCR